jgi:hypothetical protein
VYYKTNIDTKWLLTRPTEKYQSTNPSFVGVAHLPVSSTSDCASLRQTHQIKACGWTMQTIPVWCELPCHLTQIPLTKSLITSSTVYEDSIHKPCGIFLVATLVATPHKATFNKATKASCANSTKMQVHSPQNQAPSNQIQSWYADPSI